MSIFRHHGARRGLVRFIACALCILTLFVIDNRAFGQDVVTIEEDWQLIVSQPDPQTFSPQVTTTFSPVGNLTSYYAVFDLNLRNLPSYEAGGMQLQLWNGDSTVNSQKLNTGTLLQVANETISWTQRMSVSNGQLAFAVVNGTSQTWGDFGGLSFSLESSLTNLNSYDPNVSIANSGVGYAGNRVTSLTLVAIRVYSAAGLLGQDTTPKVLYPRQ